MRLFDGILALCSVLCTVVDTEGSFGRSGALGELTGEAEGGGGGEMGGWNTEHPGAGPDVEMGFSVAEQTDHNQDLYSIPGAMTNTRKNVWRKVSLTVRKDFRCQSCQSVWVFQTSDFRQRTSMKKNGMSIQKWVSSMGNHKRNIPLILVPYKQTLSSCVGWCGLILAQARSVFVRWFKSVQKIHTRDSSRWPLLVLKWFFVVSRFSRRKLNTHRPSTYLRQPLYVSVVEVGHFFAIFFKNEHWVEELRMQFSFQQNEPPRLICLELNWNFVLLFQSRESTAQCGCPPKDLQIPAIFWSSTQRLSKTLSICFVF